MISLSNNLMYRINPLIVLLQKEDPLANRSILHQMVALYDYTAQGPEDLEFSEGDTIDILGEGEALQGKPQTECACHETASFCVPV